MSSDNIGSGIVYVLLIIGAFIIALCIFGTAGIVWGSGISIKNYFVSLKDNIKFKSNV